MEQRPLPGPDGDALVLACAALLDSTGADVVSADDEALRPGTTGSLSDGDFSIAVWNIQKGRHPDARAEFEMLADEHDLVLLQEYAVSPVTQPATDAAYASFTPGFKRGLTQTGVASFSRAVPLVHCGLTGLEPILRTPKATTITKYALGASAAPGETLVVVNLHAVNFSVGIDRFSEQIDDAVRAVAGHRGPLIFTGDFNTWRPARSRFVTQRLEQLKLSPVTFTDDQRVRVFGRHLDHVYVRDLEVVEATTRAVATSDHNPMFVRLRP